MKNFLMYAITMTVLGFNSCKPSLNKGKDQVTLDIQRELDGRLVRSYHYKNEIANRLNLDSLEKGYDSFQIRIWYGYRESDSMQVVVIKNKNNSEWEANLITVIPLFDSSANQLTSVNSQIKEKKPENGWEGLAKIADEIRKLNQDKIRKVLGEGSMTADAHGIAIEIGTKNMYKFYHMENVLYASDLSNAGKNISMLLSSINRELKIELLR